MSIFLGFPAAVLCRFKHFNISLGATGVAGEITDSTVLFTQILCLAEDSHKNSNS